MILSLRTVSSLVIQRLLVQAWGVAYLYRARISCSSLPRFALMKKNHGAVIQATTPSNINAFVMLSAGVPLSSLNAFIIMIKIPPRNSPPIQYIEADTSLEEQDE